VEFLVASFFLIHEFVAALVIICVRFPFFAHNT
jgi:hypothetical protein